MSCRDLFVEGNPTEARLHSRAIFSKSSSSASHKARPTKNRRNPSTQAASQGNRRSLPKILSSSSETQLHAASRYRFRMGKISHAKLTQTDSPDSLQICHRSSIHHERKARAPLPAGAGVDLGFEVEWMERHENRTAGRGCTMRLDRPLLRNGFSVASIRRMGGIG